MSTPDFAEALYVRALDRGRFDLVRMLLADGFTPRANLAHRIDLSATGQRIYDELDDAAAPDVAPLLVFRRRDAAQLLPHGKKRHAHALSVDATPTLAL